MIHYVSYAFISNYNMVGEVIAMVISAILEKACIDLHNTWEFDKSSKIMSFPQSQR